MVCIIYFLVFIRIIRVLVFGSSGLIGSSLCFSACSVVIKGLGVWVFICGISLIRVQKAPNLLSFANLSGVLRQRWLSNYRL